MKKITKALLQLRYSKTSKSGLEVARELKISRTTLGRYLDKFGIKHKNLSTIMTGKKLSQAHRDKVVKTLSSYKGQSGKDNPTWKGGRTLKDNKYIYLRMTDHPNVLSNGYFAEHRHVMEKHLGRLLTKYEHIHHINGVKHDNRIENLELVNGQTHNLITRMESRIRELEHENDELRKRAKN